MWIDTFIPELSTLASNFRSLLQSNTAFYLKDSQVSLLSVSWYILRALELWTKTIPDFKSFYKSLAFSSRILFKDLPLYLKDLKSRFKPMV